MSRLEIITVHRLAVPLIQPYRLVFGDVTQYDTLIIEATDNDGRSGYGEATVLTGYTDETIDDCWQVACGVSRAMAGLDTVQAGKRLTTLAATHPFTATAFATAIEMIEGSTLLEQRAPTAVPLVGLLDAKNETAMQSETERLLAAGYRTLKFKVGFDPARDAALVAMAQRAVRGRAGIRIDANQGYSAEQGIAFVRALDPEGIELFEQPCKAGDWDSHVAVARAAQVPMMLDESIYGMADIDKAARLGCATYIKLKLMKLVTLDALVAAIQHIRDLGMKPVLGNGVACDIGCWLEGVVAAKHIDNAGEMNGYLKARGGLMRTALGFDHGAMVLPSGAPPQLDAAQLKHYRVAHETHAAGTRASTSAKTPA